jgi:hypothetical protein
MCYLALLVKTTSAPDISSLEKAEAAIIGEADFNRDGFGYQFNTGQNLRTLDFTDFYRGFTANIFDNHDWSFAMSHFRFGTSGEKTDKNVHCWRKKGFTFAHNGFVYGLDEKKDAGACDSLLYFNSFMARLNNNFSKKNIIKTIRAISSGFSGRAIIIAPDNKVYLFGDFQAYYLKDLILISSCALDFDDKNVYGDLIFNTPDTTPKTVINGIFCLDNGKFKKMGEFQPVKKYTYTTPYARYSGGTGWEDWGGHYDDYAPKLTTVFNK